MRGHMPPVLWRDYPVAPLCANLHGLSADLGSGKGAMKLGFTQRVHSQKPPMSCPSAAEGLT